MLFLPSEVIVMAICCPSTSAYIKKAGLLR